MREDEQQIVETLIDLQDLEKTIGSATMERSRVETSSVGTSGVSSNPTIPPSYMLAINSLVDVIVLVLFVSCRAMMPKMMFFPSRLQIRALHRHILSKDFYTTLLL